MAKTRSPATKSPTERRKAGDELAELRDTVERLTQTVRILTQSVDAMTDEMQWRNNSLRDRSIPASPPFMLHDMPLDPAARDWQINRLRPAKTDEQIPNVKSDDGYTPDRSPTPPLPAGRDSMLIDPGDGQCRECGGQLEIVDADDYGLHVQCLSCGQSETSEPGAYGDEALSYYYGFAAGRERPIAGVLQHSVASDRQRDVAQLCKELADLRQFVAALILFVFDDGGTVPEEMHRSIYDWACQEFDGEILQESLGETCDPVDSAAKPATEPRSNSQKGLFSADEPDAAESP